MLFVEQLSIHNKIIRSRKSLLSPVTLNTNVFDKVSLKSTINLLLHLISAGSLYSADKRNLTYYVLLLNIFITIW